MYIFGCVFVRIFARIYVKSFICIYQCFIYHAGKQLHTVGESVEWYILRWTTIWKFLFKNKVHIHWPSVSTSRVYVAQVSKDG